MCGNFVSFADKIAKTPLICKTPLSFGHFRCTRVRVVLDFDDKKVCIIMVHFFVSFEVTTCTFNVLGC